MFERTARGTRQTATVLMSTDPERLALQEGNGFADAIVAGDDVILSGAVTEMKAGDADLEAACARTFQATPRAARQVGTAAVRSLTPR